LTNLNSKYTKEFRERTVRYIMGNNKSATSIENILVSIKILSATVFEITGEKTSFQVTRKNRT